LAALEYVEPVFGSRRCNVEIPGGARHGVSVYVAQHDDVGFQTLEAIRGGVAEDGRSGGKAEVVDGLDAKAGESRVVAEEGSFEAVSADEDDAVGRHALFEQPLDFSGGERLLVGLCDVGNDFGLNARGADQR
jgi:hypothetical protein